MLLMVKLLELLGVVGLVAGKAVVESAGGCGADLEVSSEGTFFSSPGYPVEYQENLDCRWLVTSVDGSEIDISFSSPFHIEAGYSGICYDTLTIYKGSTTSSGVLAELCGDKVPADIHHPSHSFLVTFSSDYDFHYEGFNMNLRTKGNSTRPPTTSTTEASTRPTTAPVCGVEEWHCTSGECISGEQRCDGMNDCSDSSDEQHCDEGDCGQPVIPPKPESKIINGEETIPHSFPWQVSIKGHYDEHYCGASILSPRWILTAAHCAKIVFIGIYNGDVVVVGQHDRQDDSEEGKQTIRIEEKFIHENYDSPARAQDIALLKLSEPAKLGPTVSAPCLPQHGDFGDTSSFPAGTPCILSGWGKHGPDESIPSDMFGQPWKLRQTTLPLVEDSTCSDIYLEGANFNIQPTMQCAGGTGHTSCNGDSGGPLVCNLDGRWYQVGIVSFGPSPCDAEIPAVYTRVAGFVDWIHSTVEKNGGWE